MPGQRGKKMKDREIYGSHWESALYYAEQIDEERSYMPRLIDADRLVMYFLDKVFTQKNWAYYEIEDAIDSAPTVDAVEVVRCKNCKYYGQQDSACPFLDEDGYYKELPWEDDFCSRGERKKDG